VLVLQPALPTTTRLDENPPPITGNGEFAFLTSPGIYSTAGDNVGIPVRNVSRRIGEQPGSHIQLCNAVKTD
jgi:hypothetical protein